MTASRTTQERTRPRLDGSADARSMSTICPRPPPTVIRPLRRNPVTLLRGNSAVDRSIGYGNVLNCRDDGRISVLTTTVPLLVECVRV
jgi:hypothetical protein